MLTSTMDFFIRSTFLSRGIYDGGKIPGQIEPQQVESLLFGTGKACRRREIQA